MLFKEGDEFGLSDETCWGFDLVEDENVANAVHVHGPGIKAPLYVAGHNDTCRGHDDSCRGHWRIGITSISLFGVVLLLLYEDAEEKRRKRKEEETGTQKKKVQ